MPIYYHHPDHTPARDPEPTLPAARTGVDMSKRVKEAGGDSLLASYNATGVILEKGVAGTAEVALVLDGSYSMDARYQRPTTLQLVPAAPALARKGFWRRRRTETPTQIQTPEVTDWSEVQRIARRVLAGAARLAPQPTLSTYMFSDRCEELPDIRLDNLDAGIEEVNKRYHRGSATYYAPVMRKIVQRYANSKLPVYVLFLTDGEAHDPAEARQVLFEAAYDPIFWQFVGLGSKLQTLIEFDKMTGRKVYNANLMDTKDIDRLPDPDLYRKMMAKYPHWLQNPKVQKMLADRRRR